jgi:hypothetical protein
MDEVLGTESKPWPWLALVQLEQLTVPTQLLLLFKMFTRGWGCGLNGRAPT